MHKKLTLSLDESVIEKAKVYAQDHQISLSRLIESYLSALVEHKTEKIEITPLVDSLSGIISLPEDFDSKSSYTDFLLEKYR